MASTINLLRQAEEMRAVLHDLLLDVERMFEYLQSSPLVMRPQMPTINSNRPPILQHSLCSCPSNVINLVIFKPIWMWIYAWWGRRQRSFNEWCMNCPSEGPAPVSKTFLGVLMTITREAEALRPSLLTR